jgi:hypothetical protein
MATGVHSIRTYRRVYRLEGGAGMKWYPEDYYMLVLIGVLLALLIGGALGAATCGPDCF